MKISMLTIAACLLFAVSGSSQDFKKEKGFTYLILQNQCLVWRGHLIFLMK